MKHPLVEKLEQRLLPEFEEVAERIRQEIPHVSVQVLSRSSGLENYLRHWININCWLKGAYYLEDVDLDLEVGIEHLATKPRIDATVCWEQGYIEAEFFSDWTKIVDLPEASDEILAKLSQDLPRLYEALFEALRRRKPKDLC
jgi:hypothetical protein